MKLVTYPFPMRNGNFARFDLPPDLTCEEVERIIRFIRTLPFDAEEVA